MATRDPDFYWETFVFQAEDTYWENIVFKVEDTLFRVPRHGLENASVIFADMFRLPTPVGGQTEVEGQSDDNPIVLEGYTSSEFRNLLKILYPSALKVEQVHLQEDSEDVTLSTSINLSKDEWLSILELSNVWEMDVVRATAIAELTSNDMTTPLEKVVLARKYRISTWLEQGLCDLVSQRPGSITSLDTLGVTLGWETAARVVSIREQLQSAAHIDMGEAIEFKSDCIRCPECSGGLWKYENICMNCPRVLGDPEVHYAIGTQVLPPQLNGPQCFIAFLGGIFCIFRRSFRDPKCPRSWGPKAKSRTCMSCKKVFLRSDQVLIKGITRKFSGELPGPPSPDLRVKIDAGCYVSRFFGDEVKSLQEGPTQDIG
ncbi:hypothetical protein DFP72DRAFT_1008645 [Ephemerocybe angulata]|uniref:BTB domain-containing protein n=1 Tax=Ephemerocybe angulata TaxID=980116 RepID=A0A8H6M7D2_9AGAR|nr:hypothetical protein DFP72DRAFT_1008645 [Tulosesus angulatus]